MTATVKLALSAAAITATPDAKAKPLPFAKGKGAEARNEAFGDIATLSYVYGETRAALVMKLRAALGAKPDATALDRCRTEYVIGRVGFKLQHKPGDVWACVSFGRDVVTRMAAPAKDGVKANKLRAGQIGRRTPEQHKAVRAAEEAWSQLKAEVAPTASAAKTQAERNKAKRAPAMAGSTARGAAAGSGITHSELVKPDGKPMDRAAAVAYLNGMAATMLAFSNKHAGCVPGGYATLVKRFHAEAMELAKAEVSADAIA